MLSVLFAFAGLAAGCMNQTAACSETETSFCRSECVRYVSENPCLSVPGCNWTEQGCLPTNLSELEECALQNSSADCMSVNCSWLTVPCKTVYGCLSVTANMCFNTEAEAACTAQGSHCRWAGVCQFSNRCDILQSRQDCTASSGCFWSELTMTFQNTTVDWRRCSPCFVEPDTTENVFSAFEALVGQSCSIVDVHGVPITNHYSVAAAAATGCDGGVAFAMAAGVCAHPSPSQAPATSSPSSPSSASSLAPSSALPSEPPTTSAATGVSAPVLALVAASLLL